MAKWNEKCFPGIGKPPRIFSKPFPGVGIALKTFAGFEQGNKKPQTLGRNVAEVTCEAETISSKMLFFSTKTGNVGKYFMQIIAFTVSKIKMQDSKNKGIVEKSRKSFPFSTAFTSP